MNGELLIAHLKLLQFYQDSASGNPLATSFPLPITASEDIFKSISDSYGLDGQEACNTLDEINGEKTLWGRVEEAGKKLFTAAEDLAKATEGWKRTPPKINSLVKLQEKFQY